MKLKQLSWLWNFCGWFNIVLAGSACHAGHAGHAGHVHHKYPLSPLPPANILMRTCKCSGYIVKVNTKTSISLLLLKNMKNHVFNLLHQFFLYIIFHFVQHMTFNHNIFLYNIASAVSNNSKCEK